MQSTVRHETLLFERQFHCSLETLWEAFESADARARWGRPSPTATIIYDAEDFAIDGKDIARCGSLEDPRFIVEATYLDIRPLKRILYSERVSELDRLLSVALHSVEMGEAPLGAWLKITVQIAAVDGADMADGVRHGTSAALDNLAKELGSVPAKAD